MAAVLARRGYSDPDIATRFLDTCSGLHDPFLFPHMQAVCDRLHLAVSRNEKICIHGDYDVDGITSTALLMHILQDLGAEVTFHLPNRFTEGYGIATTAIEKIAADGARLLVTVDCGIGAREQLAGAVELGLDTIVIDHHRPVAENLPPGLIISPLLCKYPFKELAGVGLAFKVGQALLGEGSADHGQVNLHPDLRRHLDLVALGTIADVVPLVDENRSLVRIGLVQLSRTDKPGLIALMHAGQVEPGRVNTGLVAFRMAPRINAAGRLDDPQAALDLLLAENEEQAEELAGRLDGFNRERQRIENQMLAEARKMIGEWPEERQRQRGYVLSSPGWHEGVIGIVASRLVELYYRPVIMIAENEEEGRGKGSGRSISDFDLHEALLEMDSLLLASGGHRAACGLTIDIASIGEFRERFASYADVRLADDDVKPRRYVDALACGRELTLELTQELSRLEPFGLGNPSVELLVTGARIQGDRITRDGQHLQCLVEAGGARAKAIGFGQAFMQEKLKTAPDWDIAFHLERNEFNGSVAPQLQLREIFHRSTGQPDETGFCQSRCDHQCPDRIASSEFWELLDGNLEVPAAWMPPTADYQATVGRIDSGLSERLIDRRNYGGISAQIARLLAGGESILLLTADVARRRRLLSHDLPIMAGSLRQTILASSRCSQTTIERRRQQIVDGGPALVLADFATIANAPGLAAEFTHLVFIDPPWNHNVLNAIARAAPTAWIHLFYCSDEVQFTRKVLEHEYDLRDPLIKVYRHLEPGTNYPLDETTERLLLAGGKYLRQPTMVARCLKILEELKLVSIEDKTEQPKLTLLAANKTELDRSATFLATQTFYRECLQFLSKSLNAKII